MANNAVQNENMSVVIGLQSTGEAGINKVRESSFTPTHVPSSPTPAGSCSSCLTN
jgi:hypothetical protein